MRTCIQGGYVVAYNEGRHELLDGGCVVYEGSQIVFVGFPDDPSFPGADRVIHMPGRLISPGLINLHCIANIDLQPLRIDSRPGGFDRSKEWFEGTEEVFRGEDFNVSALFSVAALLRHGSTTFCNVTTMASKRYEDPLEEPAALADASERLGARAYIAHNFHDRGRYTEKDGTVEWVWNRDAGLRGLDHAVELVERLRERGNDRVQGFLFPYTTETCSDELLQAADAAARQLRVPVRSHFAQYAAEAQNSLSTRGQSPVERLAELGVLGPHLTLTHAIYLRGHPQVGGDLMDDLQLLVDSGTSVAHCPIVFIRRGIALRSFQRYRDAGLNLALGTDTVPPDMLAEMRMASLLGKLVDEDAGAADAAAVFEAATLGGARALGRDDLGRLAPGAKADISVFNLQALHVGVVDDPLKALVHYGNGSDTEMVVVDGRTVVSEGRVIGIDEDEILTKAQKVWWSYRERLADRDPWGRHHMELYPWSLPTRSK